MTMVLLLSVFIAFSWGGCLYGRYRKKVPTPYDICVDEYAPFGVRRFTSNGHEIGHHEFFFLRRDLKRRKELGFVTYEEFFDAEGRVIVLTPERRQEFEKYRAEWKKVEEETQGEVDADAEFMSRLPFAFRRTHFVRP